jgi:hypothetical protein
MDGGPVTLSPPPGDAAAAVAEAAAIMRGGATEPLRIGAAYTLAELARAGAAEQAVGALSAALQEAAIPVADGWGQHRCLESQLRAAGYGLAAAGPAAVPTLLGLLPTVDWGAGASCSMARRVLHALGDAVEAPIGLGRIVALH